MVASFYIDVSPTKVKVIDDAINILQTQLNENGPNMGGWIVAFGYDPSRVENHPKLTIQQLNLISSSVPIMVVNQSGL
jgi:predicted amidohydrolase YtcJ